MCVYYLEKRIVHVPIPDGGLKNLIDVMRHSRNGDVPLNVVTDQTLVPKPKGPLDDCYYRDSGFWRRIATTGINGRVDTWVNEFYVHPRKDCAFRRREDVVDDLVGKNGRLWRVPSSLIPNEAFDVEKPALLLRGVGIDHLEDGNKCCTIAYAPEVIVIHPSMQSLESQKPGKVDPATGIPILVGEEETRNLKEEERRWLIRGDDAAVRRIYRSYDISYFHRRSIFLCEDEEKHMQVIMFETREVSDGGMTVQQMLKDSEEDFEAVKKLSREIRIKHLRSMPLLDFDNKKET